MKNHQFPRILSLLLLLFALILTACNSSDPSTSETTAATTTATTTADSTPTLPAIWDAATYRESCTVGTGSVQVTLKVTADGATVTLTLLTDEETLADALLAANLCQGETSQYGLYISHVNGIRADYDLDGGYWWNLLVNGEYSMVGASDVSIAAGDVYEFVRTK